MADDDIVTVVTSDDDKFTLTVKEASASDTMRNLIEDAGIEEPIPLPNVDTVIMTKIVDYLKYHGKTPANPLQDAEKDENPLLDPFDAEFCKVDTETLFKIILAANFLDIKTLLDVTCLTVSNMIKGKTPEEIRKLFNIENDFTPEEEEQVRKENEWCEER